MQKTLTTRISLWMVALLTAIGLVAAPQLAHAHDVLIESDPEIGSTLDTTPTDIRLRFSGTPLSGQGLTNLILVTDAQGNQWQDGQVAVEGYELSIGLCEGLPQGEYTVAYRVIYSDGHTGEERFSFNNADPAAPENGAPQDCGEAVAADTSPAEADTNQTNEDQDSSSDAQTQAEENSSTSVPGWIWVVGVAGLLVIGAVVVLVLRGSKSAQDPENSSAD